MNLICAESASFPDHQPSNASGHDSWTTAASAKADSTPFASASSTSAEGTANSTTRVKISTIMVLRHLIRLLRLNYQCNEKKRAEFCLFFITFSLALNLFSTLIFLICRAPPNATIVPITRHDSPTIRSLLTQSGGVQDLPAQQKIILQPIGQANQGWQFLLLSLILF